MSYENARGGGRQNVHTKRDWSDEDQREYLRLLDQQKKIEREKRLALGKSYKGPVRLNPKQAKEREKNILERIKERYRKALTNGDSSGIINTDKNYDSITTIEQAHDYLNSVFAKVEKSVFQLDEELIIENTNQLKELNDKFGILSNENTGTLSGKKIKSIAETNNFFSNTNNSLTLSGKYYSSREFLVSVEKRMQNNLFSMPFGESKLSVATITHEYGHMLENELIRRRIDSSVFANYDMLLQLKDYGGARHLLSYEGKKQAAAIKDEIIAIAKQNNPLFSIEDNLLKFKYANKNDLEFFAEVFANSQCGTPNELGNAMLELLKRSDF